MASSVTRSKILKTIGSNQFRFFVQSRAISSIQLSQNRGEKLMLNLTPRSISLESTALFQKRFLFSSKSTEEPNKENKEAEEGEQQPEVSENEKLLAAKVVEMEEKNAELLDKYRRSLADFENLRNRMNKQVADAKVFGIQGFCKDLLDVADVLSKAVDSVPSEVLQSESQHLRDMHMGLKLTQSQLLHVFERHGLVQENPMGEKFDPNKHDALFQVPMPDKDANTVIDVQKVGYILQGRTIRPAAVGVSRK
eukprot:TRINITY_DN16390_c0_g1_i1.p1 TRINITY_DN16390_c0_g1~~TRINITY_DN16390_c0_g1_i1.p1  ORF type:complete len:252 (+),score=54.63 TRINITY_DN16390_c0_g1_i1:55-810(+)